MAWEIGLMSQKVITWCAAQAKDYGYLLNNGNSKGKVKGFKVTGETEDVNYNQFKIENCKIFK